VELKVTQIQHLGFYSGKAVEISNLMREQVSNLEVVVGNCPANGKSLLYECGILASTQCLKCLLTAMAK
jgi:hypothetical protein